MKIQYYRVRLTSSIFTILFWHLILMDFKTEIGFYMFIMADGLRCFCLGLFQSLFYWKCIKNCLILIKLSYCSKTKCQYGFMWQFIIFLICIYACWIWYECLRHCILGFIRGFSFFQRVVLTWELVTLLTPVLVWN